MAAKTRFLDIGATVGAPSLCAGRQIRSQRRRVPGSGGIVVADRFLAGNALVAFREGRHGTGKLSRAPPTGRRIGLTQ